MPSIRYTPNNPGGQLVDDPLDAIESGNRNAALQAAGMNNSMAMNNAMTQQALAALKERGYEFGQGRADNMAMFREGLARDTQHDQLEFGLKNSAMTENNRRYNQQWDTEHALDPQINDLAKGFITNMSGQFGGGGAPAAGAAPAMPAKNPFAPPDPNDPSLHFDMPADGVKPNLAAGAAPAAAPAGGAMDYNKMRQMAVQMQMIAMLRNRNGGGGPMQIPDFEMEDLQRQDAKRGHARNLVQDDIKAGRYDAVKADAGDYPGVVPDRDPIEVEGEPDVQDAVRRMSAAVTNMKNKSYYGGITGDDDYKQLIKALNDGVEAMGSKLVNKGKARAYLMNKLGAMAPPTQLGTFENNYIGAPGAHKLGEAVLSGLPTE